MRRSIVCVICLAFLSLSVPAWAEVVKMVDENGKVYYTNVLPRANQSKSTKKYHSEQYTHPNRALTNQEAGALSSGQVLQIEEEIDECLKTLGASACRHNERMIHMFSTAKKWYIIHDKSEEGKALTAKWFQ